jgi:hypothetical protein
VEAQTTNPITANPGDSPSPKYKTPPGHRVLHLVIPAETFAQLHRAAIDSNMRFTAYMGRFLKEALPYGRPEAEPATPSR